MLLERTIHGLDIGDIPEDQALEMAQMGYMQWLGALPGNASYAAEVQRAYARARPFAPGSPAVARFCALLQASIEAPLTPLDLKLPDRRRRGGAKARRASL